MRILLTYCVVLSVLFMTTDSAADIAIEGHPHENTVHADELFDGQKGTESNNLESDHCESCCHGHFAGMILRLSPLSVVMNAHVFVPGHPEHVRTLNQAPPTPPPNA